jgi:aryl-alcohol dehydrogenase-like predicted oxidoreductase
MQKRRLGRTGLMVSPIALGGASLGYRHKSAAWDPYTDEGRAAVVRTINHAIDSGVNYLDTAPLYGNGHSESLIGEVMKTRRQEVVLATKAWFELDRQGVIDCVHGSLKRLNTEYIDIVQIHGRMYTQADFDRVTGDNGPLQALRELRDAGKIGHIGITTDEPWTTIQFLPIQDISVYQIAYNFIYQAAARHFLIEAAKVDAGVVTMRTMTSGVLQRAASYLAPEWQAAHDLYDVSLKFVLSDSRVASGLISMRFPEEVDLNVGIATNWKPPIDFAQLPRLTFQVYEAEDADNA